MGDFRFERSMVTDSVWHVYKRSSVDRSWDVMLGTVKKKTADGEGWIPFARDGRMFAPVATKDEAARVLLRVEPNEPAKSIGGSTRQPRIARIKKLW